MIPQEPSALRERVVLSRLRRAGYQIEGRPCRAHDHRRAHVARYWLVRP